MPASLKIFQYDGCSTCKQALKFLKAHGIAHESVAIVETPPSLSELKAMLALQGGELKKLFNTSGQVYRELKLGEKLPTLSESQALELLRKNGKLVKRPFVLGEKPKGGKVGLLGFKEPDWKKALTSG